MSEKEKSYCDKKNCPLIGFFEYLKTAETAEAWGVHAMGLRKKQIEVCTQCKKRFSYTTT